MAEYIREHLRIGNDQLRRFAQRVQRVAKPFRRATRDDRADIQQIARHLHLRQNQPSLRRLHILRHDQQHAVARFDQMARDRRQLKILRRMLHNSGLYLLNSRAGCRAGAHKWDLPALCQLLS